MLGFSKVNENISRFSAPNIAGNVWNHEELPKWTQLQDFFPGFSFLPSRVSCGRPNKVPPQRDQQNRKCQFSTLWDPIITKKDVCFQICSKNPHFFGSAQIFPFFRSWDHKTRRWYFPIKFLLPLFPSPPSSSSSSFQRTKPYDYDNIMIVTSYH